MNYFPNDSLLTSKNYSDDFLSCIKWKLSSSDFIAESDNQLFYLPNNQTYDLSYYFLREDGSALVCIPTELHPGMAFIDQAYMFIAVATIFFLVLSIAIHIWVVREIRGKVVYPIIFHKGCLVVFYVNMCLINAKFCKDYVHVNEVLIVICFYTGRAAYCWLNVISFDMWQAFQPESIKSFSQHSPLCRFALQSLYAFGVPALIIGTCILFHFLQEPDLNPWKYVGPIYGNKAQFLFIVAAASTSVFANAIFGIAIMKNIHHIRRSNLPYITLTTSKKEMFVIYLKLVIVSGVLYFLHIGQVIAMIYYPFSAYWLYFDWPANAQGLWLFLIYCCNPSILKATKKKVQAVIQKNSRWLNKLCNSE